MKLRFSFAALAVAAFLLPNLSSSPAMAAGPTGPSAADRATARALAAEAHRAFDAKDYATAADRFARADTLIHAPTLMLGLARAQVALGKLVAANETYNQILREGLAANASKVFLDAVEDARKELATVTPRLCWVTVTVAVTGPEAGYKVLLDGVEIPSAAIGVPRAVDPGQHLATVTVVEGGTGKAEATLTIEEGKSQTVPIQLKVEPPPPGTPAFVPGGAGAGVVVAPPPPPPPPHSWAIRRTAGYVSLGVGGAGIVVGAITGAMVLGQHGSLASTCTGGRCPPSEQSSLSAYNTEGAVSTVGFIAGGVLVAAGAVLVLTVPKSTVPRVGLSVLPAAGGGTFSATGSF
jgi:hypothetical protein